MEIEHPPDKWLEQYSRGTPEELQLGQVEEHLLVRESCGKRVAKHPLLGMPGFVQDLLAGQIEQEAGEHFARENWMAKYRPPLLLFETTCLRLCALI